MTMQSFTWAASLSIPLILTIESIVIISGAVRTFQAFAFPMRAGHRKVMQPVSE
jgi:hypothetical protein